MIPTTRLETSKLLKDAGFRQDTYLYHVECDDGEKNWYQLMQSGEWDDEEREIISAPTTDELLEELPFQTKIYKGTENVYIISYSNLKDISNEVLPEALAQCWLWLKKENLL
jgi:hypothetical protein